jgi:hypothetical protein
LLQVSASMISSASDQQQQIIVPRLYDLPPQILCRVADLSLHVILALIVCM